MNKLPFDATCPHRFTVDQVRKLISQKTTLIAAGQYLESVGESKSDCRCFLLAFLIAYYPKESLDHIFTPIYFASKNLINDYVSGNTDSFKSKFKKYCALQRQWQDTDKQVMLHELLVQYFDLDNTLDQATDASSLNHLEQRRRIIYKRLKMFDQENLIESWQRRALDQNLTKQALVYTIKAETLTGFEYYGEASEIIGKMAFFDCFAEMLEDSFKLAFSSANSITPVIVENAQRAQETIYSTIEFFKTKMAELTPKIPKLKEYYDEHLDTEYIKQLLDHGIFNQINLDQLVRFSAQQLKNLDSEYGAIQIDQWLQRWDSIVEWGYEVYEVLPWIMRDFINKAERLKGMFQIYKNQSK